MRIPCPFCGERELAEFVYLGDANSQRPADPFSFDAPEQFYEAIYLRENPPGPHNELWYHSFGCHRWLRVKRDTRTHEILGVEFAKRADL